MRQEQTFDWMRQQLTGFMHTQILAAAATLLIRQHPHGFPRCAAIFHTLRMDSGTIPSPGHGQSAWPRQSWKGI